ncbi:MAG: hypothetical protein ACOCVC_05280 [Spirochaeta sp.]
MQKVDFCFVVVLFGFSGCVVHTNTDWVVSVPVQPPGPMQASGDIIWQIRWADNRCFATSGDVLLIPGEYYGGVAAIPYTCDGFRLGPGAGAVLRRFDKSGTIRLRYEDGWIAAVAIGIDEAGGSSAQVNIDRIQSAADKALGGRGYLLNPQDIVEAVLAGTMGARVFQCETIAVPAELDGWNLHYPPLPELPDGISPGLHLMWHPDYGTGWIQAVPGEVSWGRFSPEST